MALIEFSRNKQLASQVNLFTALAPVGRINNAVGAFKLVSDILPEIVAVTDKLGGSFLWVDLHENALFSVLN